MNKQVGDLKAAAEITAPHVLQAISAVMEEMSREGIGKGRRNTQQGYNFRGIDDVYNALAPVLSRHALVITPRCLSRDKEVVATAKGGTLFYVTVDMEFELASAVDGSTKTARMYGEAMDSADKATNKAMSAAFKYMAMQEFCIPTEGDNDADATTHQVAPPSASDPKKTTGANVPQTPTLVDRAHKLVAALRAQKTEAELRKAYGLASKLCADLSEANPDLLASVETIYAGLLDDFTKAKDAGFGRDLGIGDDEVPY